MKRFLAAVLCGGLCATSAFAQAEPAEGPPAPAEAAPPPEAGAPEAGAPDAAPASDFTEAEIDSFAKATLKLREIQSDTALDDDQRQAAMAAAVEEAGLDPTTYNRISSAVGTDTALRDRIVAAMSEANGAASPG